MKTIVELPYLPDPNLNPNKRLHHYGVAKASCEKYGLILRSDLVTFMLIVLMRQ